jgi:hypothetical protein
MERRDDEPPGGKGSTKGSIPGSRAGDQVGLGRVIEDRRSTGSPDNDELVADRDPAVEAASEDSFPASDPPGFTSDAATPRTAREPHEAR